MQGASHCRRAVRAAQKKLPHISLATVYRNLEILSEAGMIRKLEISGRQKRFDRQIEQHHHIYCVQCHRVDNLNVETVSPDSASDIGYRISDCRIEFFGICHDCQRKNERRLPTASTGEAALADGAVKLSGRQRKVLHASCFCTREIAATVKLEPSQSELPAHHIEKKGLVASPARCQYELTTAGKELINNA